MTIDEMIAALTEATNDICAVIADLRDAKDGDLDLADVNTAYAEQAARITREVSAAIRAA